MRTNLKAGLLTLAIAAPLSAATALSVKSPAQGAQGFILPKGLLMVQGDTMGQGRMMDQDRMGDMMGQGGMGGMMNMMQQMSRMMESCNEMMQAMMDQERQRPNQQWRDRQPDRESPQQ